MTEETKLRLFVGRTYRAKKPANAHGFVNDRTVVWIGHFGTVQYDGPAVAIGRKLPQISSEAFLKWASADVSELMPAEEYAPWPPAP